MQPKLSVALITRGRPALAEDLIHRLSVWMDLTGQHELVVSDDSDDDRLRSAAVRDGAMYFHNAPPLGQFANASAAVRRSSGEWVVIAHDDDDLLPTIADVVATAPGDAVIATGLVEFVGASPAVDAAHQKKLRAIGLPSEYPIDGAHFVHAVLRYGNPLVFSSTAFRRDAAVDVGLFDTSLRCLGDWEFWMRLIPRGAVVFQDVVVGRYVTHDSNYTYTQVAGRDRRIERPLVTVEALLRSPDKTDPELVGALGRKVWSAIGKNALQRHRLDLVVRLARGWRELRRQQ